MELLSDYEEVEPFYFPLDQGEAGPVQEQSMKPNEQENASSAIDWADFLPRISDLPEEELEYMAELALEHEDDFGFEDEF